MAKASKEVESHGGVGKLSGFARSSLAELKKVHSPTRQETIQATIVCLVMLVLFAVFLGFADLIVGKILQQVLT